MIFREFGMDYGRLAAFFIVAVPAIMLATHGAAWLAKCWRAAPEDGTKRVYTFEEFKGDLVERCVPVEEILEKCSGKVPGPDGPGKA